MGIFYSTKSREKMHAFNKFSVNPSKIVSFFDANWGVFKTYLYLNYTHLISYHNYLIQDHYQDSLYGLVDLYIGLQNDKQLQLTVPRKQKYIPLMNAVNHLSFIIHLIQDLNVTNTLIKFPIQIYNDNEASTNDQKI